MSCYHPLKAWVIGKNPRTGKDVLKVTGYLADHLELDSNGNWNVVHQPMRGARAVRVVRDFTEIPCGHCIGCRMDYSRQWANRMMLENELHDSAYFVTLTYDDDHVPRSSYTDVNTGELLDCLTLRKKDFQDFMKRLRYYFPDDKIRFFACGEYGGKTFRPHYHAILFGLHLDDLKMYKRSPHGDWYYTSEMLSTVWPFGWVVVSPVSWQCCAYTARYVTKKLSGEGSFYEDHNIEPIFCLMSRKPGIAHDWFVQHPDCYDHKYIVTSSDKGSKKFLPPKYFDHMLEELDPTKYQDYKASKALAAEQAMALELAGTDLSYLDYLATKEESFKSRIASLKRGGPGEAKKDV